MKRYKIVDRKAPRYRRSKYRYNLINKDLWNKFKEETKTNISWNEYKKINEYINLEIKAEAIRSREGVLLPEQMGNLWLGLFKLKERPINENLARNTGVHSTYFSFETSGLQGKILWDFDRVRYKVKNYPYWGFIAHRDFKTEASHSFKEVPELYSRIIPIITMEEFYKRLKLENEPNTQGSNISSEDTEQIC